MLRCWYIPPYSRGHAVALVASILLIGIAYVRTLFLIVKESELLLSQLLQEKGVSSFYLYGIAYTTGTVVLLGCILFIYREFHSSGTP